jgi:hypothetical protein
MPNDDDMKAKACALATHCAMRATMLLDEKMKRGATMSPKMQKANVTLKIHVGVGCGQIGESKFH